MTLTEKTRYDLHHELKTVIGANNAGTLMELLPPVGWADVATKADLIHLEERIGSRLDSAAEQTASQFGIVDERFKRVDLQFAAVDRRFDDARKEREDIRAGLRQLQQSLNVFIYGFSGTAAAAILGFIFTR